jgi:hypothetical protein
MAELERKLSSKKAACLQFVSVELGIGPNVTHPGKKVYKAHWVRSLIDWVCDFLSVLVHPLNLLL